MSPRYLLPLLGHVADRCRRGVGLLWALEARWRGARLGERIEFSGRPIITLAPGARLTIGNGCHLASAPRATLLGNAQPCVLRVLAPNVQISLGQRVGMSSTVLCAGAGISIGEGTICGAGALIIDTDFHAPAGEWGWNDDYAGLARPIVIGRGCFIGARAIILKGVTLGDRVIVGAGAVVTRDVPSGSRVVGNPARILSATSGATDARH